MQPVAVASARPADDKLSSRVFWLLVVYLSFEYLRLQNMVPVLSVLHIPMLLTVVLGGIWLSRGSWSTLGDPLLRLYLIFIFLAALGITYARNHYWVVENSKILAIYLIAVGLPFITFMNTPARLLRFFHFWIILHGLLAIRSLTSEGVGGGSFLLDENDMAMALCVGFPYAYYLSQLTGNSKFRKVLYLVIALLLALGVVATQSRGGFIGLAVSMVVIVLFGKHKMRNLLILSLFGTAVYFSLSASYKNELENVTDTHESTASHRLFLWRRATEMWVDNPVLGIATGNFPSYVGEYVVKSPEFDPRRMSNNAGYVAHSLYFTLLAEFGTVGVLVYAAIVIGLIKRLGRLRRKLKQADEKTQPGLRDLHLLGLAFFTSLMGFLATAAFITVVVYPHIWYLLCFVVAYELVAQRQLAEAGALERPRQLVFAQA